MPLKVLLGGLVVVLTTVGADPQRLGEKLHKLLAGAGVLQEGVLRVRREARTWSRSVAAARCTGSRSRQRFRNATKSSLHAPSIGGIPSVVMVNSAFIGGWSMYGGAPSDISRQVMPKLQTSTFVP